MVRGRLVIAARRTAHDIRHGLRIRMRGTQNRVLCSAMSSPAKALDYLQAVSGARDRSKPTGCCLLRPN